tara:strand:+ start:21604 stop:22815 length:1212 start_codon:yes stop_codon:yes gene_type:complete
VKSSIGIILALTCIFSANGFAQLMPMGLNQVPLEGLGDQPHYNFWVGGHICGSHHKANKSVYPAAGFVANTGMFEASSAQFVMLLGDSFTNISPIHADAMRRTLGSVPLPVINVMGKTEHAQHDTYQAIFNQQANTQFMIGPDVCLVVDSFAPNWDWLAESLQTISQTPAMRHVFIFAAGMPWGNDDLLPTLPTKRQVAQPVTLPSAKAFNDQVKPTLLRLSQIKNVYWFAGNINNSHIHQTYHWKSPDSTLTIVANAMTGSIHDSMLNVQVDAQGLVHINTVSLTTGMIADINTFGSNRWLTDTAQWRKDHPQAGFYAYFKHKSKEVLISKKFAAGIFGGLVFGVFVMLIKRPTTLDRKVRRPSVMRVLDDDDYIPMPTPQPHDVFSKLDDEDKEDDSRQAA